MNRSVNSRNFIGAFLGGSCGILSAWYLHPAVLPFAVLLGVLVGWWNKDIAHLFVEAHRKSSKARRGFIGMVENVLSGVSRLGRFPALLVSFLRVCVRGIVRFFSWIVSVPLRLFRWLADHPMNRAKFIELSIMLFFLFGVPALVFFFGTPSEEGFGGRIGYPMLAFLLMVAGFVPYVVRHDSKKNSELSEMGAYYREWEIITRYTLVGFFFYALGRYFRYMLGALLALAVVLPWWIGTMVGSIVAVLFFSPVIFAVYLLQGIYKIAIRAGHWLCLGVTMTTALLFWFLYHQSFSDPRVLWTVALSTGTVSGLTTMFLQKCLSFVYDKTGIGRKFAEVNVGDVYFGESDFDGKSGYDLFEAIFTFWSRQNRLARGFRAFCFNSPIEQPVKL